MAKVPLGKLARAMRLVSSGMGSSGWACRDILILLQLFMKHFLMTFFLYSTLFSFPCPLVRTKFPSRVMNCAPTFTRAYLYISGWLMERWAPPPVANKRYKYLRAVYIEVGHVYALFTFYRLHFHQKLVARFTHPETVTNL